MKKIERMVKAYNRYAVRHAYPASVIEVDYENKKVIGKFTPRDENACTGFIGFFRNAMTTGHNASLKADYERIVEAVKCL